METENAAAISNSRDPRQTVRNTGPPKLSTGKMIEESDGALIHYRQHRLEHRAEHFREQFTSPTTIVDVPTMPASESIPVLHQN